MREIVFDTETTGTDPANGDRIVEIGAVELLNHIPTGRTFHAYLNPERPMSQGALAVHGLTDAFLADKPVFAAIADAIAANQRPGGMATDETTVYDFVSELLSTGHVSDASFQRVKDAFGERGVVDLMVHDLRDFTTDRHRVVDDTPFGGGGGQNFTAGALRSIEAMQIAPDVRNTILSTNAQKILKLA